MAETLEKHNKVFVANDIRSSFDERLLPSLIQSQIGKLNELNACVKSALDAAEQAEKCAKAAGELSAGRGFFKDKKREAIEELQSAGINLAGAVQSGAKAQKTAFEFQTRLVEVTKYLFSLGVSNIAANRVVVRELEARLRGASEAELSELARQEIMAVVIQLKEQEDLLKKLEDLRDKQARMDEELKAHNKLLSNKIAYVLTQTDDLDLRLKDQTVQQQISLGTIDGFDQELKRQKEEVSTLRQQVSRDQVQTNDALKANDSKIGSLLEKIDGLDHRFTGQEAQQRITFGRIDDLAQDSKQQKQEMLSLQQQVFEQQALVNALSNALASAEANAEQATVNLRSVLNQRMAVLVILALALPAVAYFLR